MSCKSELKEHLHSVHEEISSEIRAINYARNDISFRFCNLYINNLINWHCNPFGNFGQGWQMTMENLTNKTSKNETKKGGECDICKKYFTKKSNITRHKKIHIENTSNEIENNGN